MLKENKDADEKIGFMFPHLSATLGEKVIIAVNKEDEKNRRRLVIDN